MEQIKKVLRNSCSRQVIDIQTKTKESTPAHLHPVVFHLEKHHFVNLVSWTRVIE